MNNQKQLGRLFRFTAYGLVVIVLLALADWTLTNSKRGIDVRGNFSTPDVFAIRRAVRNITRERVLQIYEETDGRVRVTTGEQKGPLNGHGHFYFFRRIADGWHLVGESVWYS